MARRPVWSDVSRNSNGTFAPRGGKNGGCGCLIWIVVGFGLFGLAACGLL